MIRQLLIALAFVLCTTAGAKIFSLSPILVMAETGVENTRTQVEERSAEKREAVEEKRTQLQLERCEAARAKTTEQLKKFDGMKSEQDAKYARFMAKLQVLINKLKGDGVDVTQLEEDKASLNVLTTELSNELGKYADSVEVVQASAPNCTSDQAAFKKALQAARTQMTVVRTKAQAIRTFITRTLQPDLKEARAELSALKKVSPKPTPSSTPVITD